MNNKPNPKPKIYEPPRFLDVAETRFELKSLWSRLAFYSKRLSAEAEAIPPDAQCEAFAFGLHGIIRDAETLKNRIDEFLKNTGARQ